MSRPNPQTELGRATRDAPELPTLYFVTGLHRSGTTILSDAITQSVGAATLTVADLAAHIPCLGELASKMKQSGRTIDERGKSREIRPSTSVEYGWYFYSFAHRFAYERRYYAKLRELTTQISRRSGVDRVVLKNPWDTRKIAELLLDFPNAVAIVIRRNLSDIESSVDTIFDANHHRADRAVDPDAVYESKEYIEALLNGDRNFKRVAPLLKMAFFRRLVVATSLWGGRVRLLMLIRSLPRLPLHRVAFISYDELTRDPELGALWAAHILDPMSLATSVRRVTSPTSPGGAPMSGVAKALDAYWERTWSKARRRQLQAGLLSAEGLS